MEQINKQLMSWASIIDPNALAQAIETSRMPFIHPHVALMPDAHFGMGATVGSVIPTLGAIIPAAVGVDIGCGMMAVRTQWMKDDVLAKGELKALHASLVEQIPSSAGQYNAGVKKTAKARVERLHEARGAKQAEIVSGEHAKGVHWEKQLGSLGGGNHFIELSLDEEDRVWTFLHSGSRGVGNRLAQRHIKVAAEQCKKRFVDLPNRDLAYLVEGDPEFWEYMDALHWGQLFAALNREEMMERFLGALGHYMGEEPVGSREINCHHNYTVKERHWGKDVWLSRKGAIDAHEGVPGLIPGSMGDRSYVTIGKGNPLSLCSSPHGAGRVHSRSSAKREFTYEQLEASMEGIVWGENAAFIDEIPGAYKPIDVVMKDADDLVTVEHELRQILNVKGI